MARAIRIEYKGAVYHVCARGQRKEAIFNGDHDREIFLEMLKQSVERYGLGIYGYCLMCNHYHLLVGTSHGNLAQGIGWLQGSYAMKFNWRNRLVGHVFQGRYKAHLVDSDAYAQQLIEYVHLNPVRIGVNPGELIPGERREELEKYRWSSHGAYAGSRKPAEWLDMSWRKYYGNEESRQSREYRRAISRGFCEKIESPWNDLYQGLILGGEEFIEEVKRRMRRKTKEKEQRWLLQDHQRARNEKVDALIKKEKDPKVQIWLRIRMGHEQMSKVGRVLGYQNGSAIYQILTRLEKAARLNNKLLNKLRSYEKKCCVL